MKSIETQPHQKSILEKIPVLNRAFKETEALRLAEIVADRMMRLTAYEGISETYYADPNKHAKVNNRTVFLASDNSHYVARWTEFRSTDVDSTDLRIERRQEHDKDILTIGKWRHDSGPIQREIIYSKNNQEGYGRVSFRDALPLLKDLINARVDMIETRRYYYDHKSNNVDTEYGWSSDLGVISDNFAHLPLMENK